MIGNFLIIPTIIGVIFVNNIRTACVQKNTNREADRDVFICRNQLFETGKKLSDLENCQCYYQCSYRQQPCYYCCPDGQHFHQKLGCIIAKSSNCVNQSPEFICPPESLDAKYPHKHCRKYWDCFRGRPIERSCSTNEHWNDRRKQCVRDINEINNPTKCDHI